VTTTGTTRSGRAASAIPVRVRYRNWVLPFLIGLAAIGCVPGQDTATTKPAPERAPRMVKDTGQIIIKFRSATVDPSDPEVLAALSASAGTPLTFVRPMSGGAFVLRAGGITDPQQLAEVIRRLGARSDVEYVEPDRLMRPMTSPESSK
jgi:hypothetical protein